jgi:hypothetical protein
MFKLRQVVAVIHPNTKDVSYVQIRYIDPDKDYRGRTVYHCQGLDGAITRVETMLRELTSEEKGE